MTRYEELCVRHAIIRIEQAITELKQVQKSGTCKKELESIKDNLEQALIQLYKI